MHDSATDVFMVPTLKLERELYFDFTEKRAQCIGLSVASIVPRRIVALLHKLKVSVSVLFLSTFATQQEHK